MRQTVLTQPHNLTLMELCAIWPLECYDHTCERVIPALSKILDQHQMYLLGNYKLTHHIITRQLCFLNPVCSLRRFKEDAVKQLLSASDKAEVLPHTLRFRLVR